MFFVICLVPSLLLWWNSHFFLSCLDESSLCLLKGGRISGFTLAHAELPVLHDAFTSTIASGCQKTSYIVQFLWRDLTSGFDLIGPHIPVPKSVDSNVKKELFMLCLKKILCGFPKTTPPHWWGGSRWESSVLCGHVVYQPWASYGKSNVCNALPKSSGN